MSEPSTLAKMAQECLADSRRWFPDVQNLPTITLALFGEVGEFANWVKKIERGSVDAKDMATRNAMAEELADVLTYLLVLAGLMRVDLEHVYRYKRAINERRFGKDSVHTDNGRVQSA